MTKRWSIALIATAALMAGCAIDKPPAPVAAPVVQPLEQTLQEAAQADASGSKERARELYRAAAKSYPASKAPWLQLAEGYFEAANYGQAILAAQEVLQRDSTDAAATSVLAVSGLRVSSSALGLLRQQQRALGGGTRVEAEDLARVLREQLGEPVLVPRSVVGTSANAGARKRPTAAPKPAAVAATTAASAPARTGAANPFSVLKN